MKVDSTKRYRTDNICTAAEFLAMIEFGVQILRDRYDDIPQLINTIKAALIDASPHILRFSKIARYMVNGFHNRYWYEETNKQVRQLLPEFDSKLIFDLLAATSIRASIEANTKKFLQALHQYYSTDMHDVRIKQRNWQKTISSSFHRHLDAVVHHLDRIKQGKGLSDDESLIKARKIKMFSRAMNGDPRAIPADIWICRMFGTDIQYPYKGKMTSRAPTAKLYDAIYQYLCTIADLAYMEPRQVSATGWTGIRGEFSNSKETMFGPLLEKVLDHGLYKDLFGELAVHQNGVGYKNKKSPG